MDQQDSTPQASEPGAIEMDVNDFRDESEQVEQPTTAEESSTDESKEAETDESTDAPESESSDEKPDDSAEESTDEDKSKSKNTAQNRIRSLANENRELRKKVETLNAQVYAPQSAQELAEQGMDPIQAQVEALRQENEIRDFNNRVAQINSDLNVEAVQVLNDFPVFDPKSSDYDEAFASKVQNLYQQAAALETDPNTGLVLNANVLPYDFYKEMAELHTQAKVKGEVNRERAQDKQLASVDVQGRNKTSTPEESDPFLKGFTSV